MHYTRQVEKLRPGVNIYGYVFAEHGIGEAVRLNIEILKQAKVEYAVIPYVKTGSRQQTLFADLGARESIYDINFVNINADTVPDFVDQFGQEALRGRYNIGMWSWEIEDLPERMARSAKYFDEIWACSSFTAKAIAKSVSCPVYPLTHPITISPQPPRKRADLGLTDDFLFLFCSDFNSIFERKNPLSVIHAFTQAFEPGEGARLLIKTINGSDFQEPMERLNEAALGHPDVDIVDGYLSAAEQRDLMNTCDAYVSLHRAEGYGLTLAETMALGKPVIATGYSGNLDFMTEDNSYLVPYLMKNIPEGCAPYPQTSQWAEPSVEMTARYMRRVFEQRNGEARQKAERAKQDIERYHGPEARADFVIERLEAIREQRAQTPPATNTAYTVTGWADDPEAGAPDNGTEAAAASRPHRAFQSIRELLGSRLVTLTHDQILPDEACGRLDDVKVDDEGGVAVWGWAIDPRTQRPARAVTLLLNKKQLPARIPVGDERLDVAKHLGDPESTAVGWSHYVSAHYLSKWENVFEAFAMFDDGRFGKIGGASGGRVVLPGSG